MFSPRIRLVLGLALCLGGCSRNPATGRLQVGLIDESEEIRMGRAADEELREQVRVYTEKAALGGLVAEVGSKIARQAERPDLPWSFTVLDDPAVNAFAVPGGFIYVTRGLLGHLNSEDELAAVLSHEIGHVTARHAAVQLRKTRTAQRSVGLFRIIDPNLRHVGGIAARSAQLALLKYSRNDEHEADDLSVRYMRKSGYKTAAIGEVFLVLAGLNKSSGPVPTWLSTHPDPAARRQRLIAMIGQQDPVGPEARFVERLDGIVHGKDPRDGYFVGVRFVHPRGGYRIDIPAGWRGSHHDEQVAAVSPDKRAFFAFAPTDYESGQDAFDAFFIDGGMPHTEPWKGRVGTVPVISSSFAVESVDGEIAGLIAFLEFGGRVLVTIALGPRKDWEPRAERLATSFASFARLQELGPDDVEPMRVKVETLSKSTTLADYQRAKPSSVSLATLALLNHVEPNAVLGSGRVVKRVVGFNPDRAGTQSAPPGGPTARP